MSRLAWKVRQARGRARAAYLAVRYRGRLRLGENVEIRGPFRLTGGGALTVGDRTRFDCVAGAGRTRIAISRGSTVTIGADCYLNSVEIAADNADISIGPECILGDALLMSTDFHSVAADRRAPTALVKTGPVTLGRNVWLGARTAILRGVTIGENSVVGFGSVVTRDVPPNSLVTSHEQRVVRPL